MTLSRRQRVGALAVILLGAIALRLTTYSKVFTENGILFLEYDAYYHMRRIVAGVENFPEILSFDTYINYPQGAAIGWPPLFDGMIALVVYVLGFGNPSREMIETIGVYAPVAIGLLALIPVFFIGRYAFSREECGIIAAGILAILPAHVLISLLGFVDHHGFEVLVFALMILAPILLVRVPHMVYYSGIMLALAILAAIYSWIGSPIFIGIIGGVMVLQFILRQMKGISSDDLLCFGVIAFGLSGMAALTINAGILGATGMQHMRLTLFQPAYLFLWLGVILVTGLFARYLSNRPWQWLAGIIAVIGVSGSAFVYHFIPQLWAAILGGFQYVTGEGVVLGTISEAQSILYFDGSLTLWPFIELFTLPLILAVLGFFVYMRARIKNRMLDDADILLAVLLLIGIVLPLYQMRFLNFLIIPIVVWGSYGSIIVLDAIGKWTSETTAASSSRRKGKKKEVAVTSSLSQRKIVIAVFLLVLIIPTAYSATGMTERLPGPPDEHWLVALEYLRTETPDPGGYSDQLITPAYGVMSFWGAGNQIIYLAERPVVANNFQVGIADSCRFFTTTDPAVAARILDRRNVRYVVTEHVTAGSFAGYMKIAGIDVGVLTNEEFLDHASNSMYFHLHQQDALDLPEFTRIYSTQEGLDAVKIFEYSGWSGE